MSFQSCRLRPPVWGQGHCRSRQAQSHRLRTSQWEWLLHQTERQQTLRMDMPDFRSLPSRAPPRSPQSVLSICAALSTKWQATDMMH